MRVVVSGSREEWGGRGGLTTTMTTNADPLVNLAYSPPRIPTTKDPMAEVISDRPTKTLPLKKLEANPAQPTRTMMMDSLRKSGCPFRMPRQIR